MIQIHTAKSISEVKVNTEGVLRYSSHKILNACFCGVFQEVFSRCECVSYTARVDLMIWIPVGILLNISAGKRLRSVSRQTCVDFSVWHLPIDAPANGQVIRGPHEHFVWPLTFCVRISSFTLLSSFQERHSDRHKESRSNPRLPSQSATYTTVSAWHHLPEKLILDSCGYEATVSPVLLTSTRKRDALFLWSDFDTQSTPVLFGICRCILSASIVKR